ncbi:MAG: alkene reductase [Bacteroidales bacterium]
MVDVSDDILFKGLLLQDLQLSNRMVMAPLTRCRSSEDGIPNKLARTYYSQRASIGLIITEATQISAQGQGYVRTPGIYTDKQVEEWKQIVKHVHDNNGKIFIQLWHVGRHSHSDFRSDGELPVAPSSIAEEGLILTPKGRKKCQVPHALSLEEIDSVINDYKIASANALEAGFDGIEIHAANGYLIDQFLQDGTNKRGDIFGGSLENRFRFLKNILEEVLKVWDNKRVGVRMSPFSRRLGIFDSDPYKHFSYFVKMLNRFPLAYLHLIEPTIQEAEYYKVENRTIIPFFRKQYNGVLIACSEFNCKMAKDWLNNNYADLIAFGRPVIANPDLLERYKNNWPLNEVHEETFYKGEELGYIDYPFYYQ